ncbi:hypothetical protein VB638_18390 [Dolichospermum sp. UHCC 0684]|jgi:hypothetical protein|uniref:hypothetical protein n=1 Tax=unclassified Dolichospermum TaxID=2622029 RepID=UPI001448120B|nr:MULTISPECIES: hypothetical protein [unclassified Dolichospermum]MEA5531513.1 hypothetical protein [Dolichospermum sp. UHCC 0684]MTJ34129.1 hypothetical protein [Dolichospermum sp. UHCC 0260]
MIKTISQYFLCSKVSLKLVALLLHHQYQWLFDLLSGLPKRAVPKFNQASLKIQNPVDVVINNSSVAKTSGVRNGKVTVRGCLKSIR